MRSITRKFTFLFAMVFLSFSPLTIPGENRPSLLSPPADLGTPLSESEKENIAHSFKLRLDLVVSIHFKYRAEFDRRESPNGTWNTIPQFEEREIWTDFLLGGKMRVKYRILASPPRENEDPVYMAGEYSFNGTTSLALRTHEGRVKDVRLIEASDEFDSDYKINRLYCISDSSPNSELMRDAVECYFGFLFPYRNKPFHLSPSDIADKTTFSASRITEDGREIIYIEKSFCDKDGRPIYVWRYWLDKDFGYAVVRAGFLQPGKMEVVHCGSDYKEVAPGIWLPRRVEKMLCLLGPDGTVTKSNRTRGIATLMEAQSEGARPDQAAEAAPYEMQLPPGTILDDRNLGVQYEVSPSVEELDQLLDFYVAPAKEEKEETQSDNRNEK